MGCDPDIPGSLENAQSFWIGDCGNGCGCAGSLPRFLRTIAEDKFVERGATLEITAVTSGYSYQSYDDETSTIRLGEVPLYTTRKAAFKLENPTTFVLDIANIEARDQVGNRWDIQEIVVCPMDSCTDNCAACRANADAPWPKELYATSSVVLEITYAPTNLSDADYVDIGIKNPRYIDSLIPCFGSCLISQFAKSLVLTKGIAPVP